MNQLPSMDQVFLKKLTDILEANLSDEHLSIEEVSHQMGVSRSQIHRKLKKLCQQSFTEFLREMRLKHAMELLQQQVATAAEIAYRVGFGSPAYFNKCFHDYYGFPPGEVKKHESQVTGQEEAVIPEPVKLPPGSSEEHTHPVKSSRKLILGLTIAGLLVVAAAVLIIFRNSSGQKSYTSTSALNNSKSIAILPFKNLSDDKGNQYFADGVMEGILNNLSRIGGLKVISRTSMEHFRGSNLTSPQIAKELGVNYLMEGSVQRDANKVRVFVKLIDARQDHHIWSEEFNKELTDLFKIESDIAKQIAIELQVALSAKEIEHIEKIPTKNPEAYNLYLKGVYFWKWRTEEGLEKSVEYFQKAVAADPDYALAYAGLADAYYIQAFYGWIPRIAGYALGKKTALKALHLDPDLTEAHATLGAILFFGEWQWEEARKELILATQLNPNYATAHQYYSELLDILGESNETRVQINRALELEPFYPMLRIMSGYYYNHEGKYKESLEESRKVEEMVQGRFGYWHIAYLIIQDYFILGDNDKAFEACQNLLQVDTTTAKYVNTTQGIYEDEGITGVLNFFIKLEYSKSHPNEYLIASFYALLGKKEEALDCMEKSINMHSSETHTLMKYSDSFTRINVDPSFISLRKEPRFLTLLKKMGLDKYNKPVKQ